MPTRNQQTKGAYAPDPSNPIDPWYGDPTGAGGYDRERGNRYTPGQPDPGAYNAEAAEQRRLANRPADMQAVDMLHRGQEQASMGMLGQAAVRGANPAAERGAVMAAGNLASQNQAVEERLRAEALRNAAMMKLQSQNALREGELGWAGLNVDQQIAAAQAAAADQAAATARRGADIGAVGAAVGGVGGALGAMISDARLKAAIDSASPEAQDEIAANMQAQAARSAALRRSLKRSREGFPGRVLYAGNLAMGGVPLHASMLYSAVHPDKSVRGTLENYADTNTAVGRNIKGHGVRIERALRGPQEPARRGFGAGMRKQWDELADDMELARFRYTAKAREALGAPSGERMGVMAQDVDDTPLGRTAVVETPAGTKAIDRDNALGLSLGLHGRARERDEELQAQIDALTEQLEKRK